MGKIIGFIFVCMFLDEKRRIKGFEINSEKHF
jgi:hypothetical protein